MATPAQLEDASLFLMQASLGANYQTINDVATQGINVWLDNQLNHTVTASVDSFKERTKTIFQDFKTQADTRFGSSVISTGNPTLPYNFYFRMAWWHRTLSKNNPNASSTAAITTPQERNAENIVRHRVAQALSEILVISDKSILELDAVGMGSFYDLLYENAFGQYNTLLKAVSLHPMMGVFLTHMNNRKSQGNQHPDENYAREIMQLFTIGLNELESDGREKTDANGNFIPTYTNKDIKELARVFTGIKASKYDYEYPFSGFPQNGIIDLDTVTNKTHITIPYVNMEDPMIEQTSQHDQGEKKLFEGRAYTITIPASQTLDQDIELAVNKLVEHPNTAPFIAKKLIQQLVSSNPSEAYIQAVASKFGTTGNLKETIKEILTHSEARDQVSKKLKSPLFRVTQLMRAFNVTSTDKKFWMRGDSVDSMLHQHVLSSPTVFNFYLPSYAPHGEIEDDNKVAPEYQLHNSSTSIAYVNMLYNLTFALGESIIVPTQISTTEHYKTSDTTLPNDKLSFDLSAEIPLLTGTTPSDDSGIDTLIERVSLILTGQHQCDIKDKIKDTLNTITYSNKPWVVQTVIFMIAMSPQFTVQRKR